MRAVSALRAEQLSVFLENRAGVLAQVIGMLAGHGINIRAVSLADTSDFGILRLIVDDIGKAEGILRSQGFTTGRTNIVAIETPDRPGGLAEILDALSRQEINVEYMYVAAAKNPGQTILIFRFDRLDPAIEILANSSIRIIAPDELYSD